MKTSLPYTRNKINSTKDRRISTFFPSFVGLALRGDDLLVCEATKRHGTRLRSIKVKDFQSLQGAPPKPELLALKAQWKPVILSWPRERTMVRELYVGNQSLQELRETLALQLDSLFPLGLGEAYFDLYPCSPLNKAEGRKICLFAINKKELDNVLSRLEEIGLAPSRIIPSPLALIPALERNAENVACISKTTEGAYVYNLYNRGGLTGTYLCDTEEGLRQVLQQDPPEAVLFIGAGGEKLPPRVLEALPEETLATYQDTSLEATGAALYETCSHPYDFKFIGPSKRGVNYRGLYLVTLIAILLSLLFAIPQIARFKNKEKLSLVEAEIEGIKERAFTLKKLEGEARVQKVLGTVQDSQKGHVPRAEVLLELSNLLPKDTWIMELSIKEGAFEVEGAATSLAETMFLLESSPIFSNVELVPPVVKDKDGKDHFRLKGLILREAVHERS